MNKPLIILIVLLVISTIANTTSATSGACSSHGGVDCSKGWQSNGKVYCNDDGWFASIVDYDYMIKCEPNKLAPECVNYINGKDVYLKQINAMVDELNSYRATHDTSNPSTQRQIKMYDDYLTTLKERQESRYYEIAKTCTADIENIKKSYYCPGNQVYINGSCRLIDNQENVVTGPTDTDILNLKSSFQNNKIIPTDNSNNINNIPGNTKLSCPDGYALSLNKKNCVKIPQNAHYIISNTDIWICDDGYEESGNHCIIKNTEDITKIDSTKKEEIIVKTDGKIMSQETRSILGIKEINREEQKQNKFINFFGKIVNYVKNLFN